MFSTLVLKLSKSSVDRHLSLDQAHLLEFDHVLGVWQSLAVVVLVSATELSQPSWRERTVI